jgi:hypothetical protein
VRCTACFTPENRSITPAIATTAASATTTTITATGAIFARPSFIDRQRPTFVFLTIESIDRCLRFCITGHFHESEALTAAAIAIRDHLGTLHRSKLRKHVFEVRATDAVAQVATIEFLSHRAFS